MSWTTILAGAVEGLRVQNPSTEVQRKDRFVLWLCTDSVAGEVGKKKNPLFSVFSCHPCYACLENKQTKKYAFNLSVITSWYLAGDSAQTGFANLFNDRVYTQECITCYECYCTAFSF